MNTWCRGNCGPALLGEKSHAPEGAMDIDALAIAGIALLLIFRLRARLRCHWPSLKDELGQALGRAARTVCNVVVAGCGRI
jgi:hypothetical protein